MAITKGKIVRGSSFASSPLSCTTLAATGVSPSLTINWTGSLNGTVGGTTYAGKAKLTSTTVSGETTSGSFSGASVMNITVPSNLGTLCATMTKGKHPKPLGIKKLGLSISVTFGSGSSAIALVASIATDGEGFCALLSTTDVDCWGDNTDGELGDGSYTNSDSPVAVVGLGGTGTLSGVAYLYSEGEGYCALLTSRSVDCWGDDTYGELGDGEVGADSPFPVQVSGLGGTGALSGVAAIASDRSDSYCALLSSGNIDCWGDNTYGQLGDNDPTFTASDVPVAVSDVAGDGGPLTGASSLVSDSYDTYCAILSGEVVCWGLATYGELGNNDPSGTNSVVPVAVSDVAGDGSPLTGVASVTNDGFGSFCAVLLSGAADCWGYDNEGQLGDNDPTLTNSYLPVPVSGVGGDGTLTGVASISSTGLDADESYCALLTSGSVDCWGDNVSGELGDNDTVDTSSVFPVEVSGIGGSGALNGVVSLSYDGDDSYCAVLVTGGLDCWGYGALGELGDGTGTSSPFPVQVSGLAGSGTLSGVASVVSDGSDTYCVVLGSGAAECWGYGAGGELGDGSSANSDLPVAVGSSLGSATGALNVSPNTGLTDGETVTVTATGLAANSFGEVLECNNAVQPSVALGSPLDTSISVGCTAPAISNLAITTSGGALSTTFTVGTGTLGPPCGGSSDLAQTCPTTDSSGGNPTTDAAAYPCPPTPSQQAAGDTCVLSFGDAAGDQVLAPIQF